MDLVYGLVTNIEYKPLRIQATLPDMGGILSPWAMVLTSRTQTAKTYDPLVVGEQVAILLTDDGETALCLGAVFSDEDTSPADSHKYVKVFDDGTRIEYDPQAKHMDISTVGTLAVTCAGDATVTAPKTTINSETTINGKTTINGDTSINGNTTITKNTSIGGSATIAKDASINGKPYSQHKHGGVERGSSFTNAPS